MGDLATMQAETRVNTEQASKRDIAEADPSRLWGRPLPLDEIATAFNGSAGVVATACLQKETNATREAPAVQACDLQPDAREGQAGPCGVTERPVVVMKPGNSGGAKGP